MPITYVFNEEFTGRPAKTGTKSGASFTVQWECRTTGGVAPSGAHVVAALYDALGVGKGVPHPALGYFSVVDVDADPQDEPEFWKVRAVYAEPAPVPGAPLNPGGAGSSGTGQPSPENREPLISGSFRRTEEFRLTDLDFAHYVNQAGDLLDNAPPRYGSVGVMTITKYYESLNYNLFKSYENKCNNATWQGFPKDSLLITGVDWKPVTEGAFTGWAATFTVEHKGVQPDQPEDATGGWIPAMVLNQGWNCRKVAGGPVSGARDDFGQQYAAPVLLDLDGVKLAAGADPVYLSFRQYDRISFAILDP